MTLQGNFQNKRMIEWRVLLFISLVIIVTASVKSIYAQSSLTDKMPKRLPLKVKFEKDKTDDLLANINVVVTNKGNKPIYFLLLDIVPTNITDKDGTKFSFRLMYGRKELYQLNEYAGQEDKPLLPGESYTLKIDPKILGRWNERLGKDKKPKPKKFDFNFRFLSFGDGSGFMGTLGNPFSGRLKKDKSGGFIRKGLMSEEAIKANKIDVNKIKSPSAYLLERVKNFV